MWFGIFFFVLLVFACVYCEWYFSRKLLSLLVELTGQARKAEHLIQDGRVSTEEIFKGPWPNNEIGDLAGTFKALVTKLKSLAMREQDFSTEVSHELRTPLAVIDTSLVILNEQCSENSKQKAVIRRAENAAARMKGMTEVFLNIGRRRASQERALTEASALVTRREAWSQEAAAKGLKVKILLEHPSEKQFNEVLGASVLKNLVFNSIYYMDKGEVSVIVKGNTIIVKDTGIGIREEDREKIFNSGFRDRRPLHQQGFGLR